MPAMKPVVSFNTKDLPFSGVFVDFMHALIAGAPEGGQDWHDQRTETLSDFSVPTEERVRRLTAVLDDPEGRRIARRSRVVFHELAVNRLAETRRILDGLRFVFVVGIPRTGGTYLVKQLFRGAGDDYRRVGHGLAHDAFPDFAPATLDGGWRGPAGNLVQLAEYLVMADIHFRRGRKGRFLAPKKFTKLVHDFTAARALLGREADFVVTLRHPLDMAQSVLEKSGGMPEGGRFAVRSVIERWALEAYVAEGVPAAEVGSMDYLDVMLGYWRRFHTVTAASGLLSAPSLRLVPFGAAAMEGAARDILAANGLDAAPEPFAASPAADFGAARAAAATRVVEDTAALWRHFGAELPVAAIMDRG